MVFGVFLVFVLAVIYIFIKRNKYTRERFAFYSAGVVFSLSWAVYLHLMNDKSLIYYAISFFNVLPLENLEHQPTSWSDKAWSILLLILVMSFVLAIYRSWGGAVSRKDKELEDRKLNMGYLGAAFQGIPIRNIEIYSLPEEEPHELMGVKSLKNLDERLDWHSEVKQLVNMRSSHYKLKDESWHSTSNLFISKFGKKTVVVCCCLSVPDSKYVSTALAYSSSFSESEISHVLIAVKKDCSYDSYDINGTKVEIKSKLFLLDELVDFSEYKNYLLDKLNNEQMVEGDDKKLADIYVSSEGEKIDLINGGESERISSVEDYLFDWACHSDCEKQISLLGEYGQGKSALSLALSCRLIESGNGRIPIIIELRGKSPRNETLLSLIADWASLFHIDPQAVFKLLQEGRLLIILEGFDEIDMVGDSTRRLEHFKRLWEFARYRKSKVIITGRPNLFLDNDETVEFLKIGDNKVNVFYSEPIHLLPFDIERVKSSLRSADEHVRNEIVSLVQSKESNDNFVDLISRPSTLYQASVIWDSLDKNDINSASVIQEFINHAYRRQEDKLVDIGFTGIDPTVLTALEREYFMLGVAVGIVKKNGYSNQINKIDLEEIVILLYLDSPVEISKDHSEGIHIKDRFTDNDKAIESIFNDVRSSGILVRDLTNNDSFKFAHKSFMEFLVAQYYYLMISEAKNRFLSDGIYKSLRFERIYDIQFSEEVISHISELMKVDNVSSGNGLNNEICKGLIERINPELMFIGKYIYGRFLGVTCSVYYLLFCLVSPYIVLVFLPVYFGWIDGGASVMATFVTVVALVNWRTSRQTSINKARSSFRIWLGVCMTFTDKDTALSCMDSKMVTDLSLEYTEDKYLSFISKGFDKIGAFFGRN